MTTPATNRPATIDSRPTGPLAGIRILDMTSVVNGAYATSLLADQGAEVIKVEDPARAGAAGGDVMRQTGIQPEGVENMGVIFLGINRNKRSVVLNLRNPDDLAALKRLIATCDAFVASVRYEGLKRLGLSYEDVRELKPDIVYAHAAGFGAEGPYAGDPAYDDLIQAATGLADVLPRTNPGMEPHLLPTLAADKVSGLFMSQALTAALLHRARTGEGQFVEVPMFECITAFTMVEHLYNHTYDPPTGDYGYPRVINPYRKPFKTRDGYIGLLPYNDTQWRQFFETAGYGPEFAEDPRFADFAARNQNIQELYALVEKAAATKTTQEWLDLLRPMSIPVMKMNRLEDLESDPHLAAVGMFRRYEHPDVGGYNMLKPPVKFSRTPANIYRHAPGLGEHNAEVLAEAEPAE
ncbi:CaiB/BaiF CoA transferase family protein [Novosphingobium bradum]|uniref:CaiB/BaiF CoA transferase family protein n=1 Tax=Novosphingobium bradum TaxID=1737444 RepID=A0ABV7ILC8_9SPHN